MTSQQIPAPGDRARRRRPATDRQRLLTLVALLVAAVLALALWLTTLEPTTHTLEKGEEVPLTSAMHSGRTHAVQIPTARLAVQVGEPMDEVDPHLVELPEDPAPDTPPDAPVRASDDTTLVPVTWGVQAHVPEATEGAGQAEAPRTAEEDSTRVEIHLVAGDEEIELTSQQVKEVIDDQESLLVAVDEEVDLSDVTITVTYAGLTQRLSPAKGDVDAGAASPLYEGDPATFDTGCTDGGCRLEPAPDSPWRLSAANGAVTADPITLRPYLPELGWAEEGKVWAVADLEIGDTGSFTTRDGRERGSPRPVSTAATLDGAAATSVRATPFSMLTQTRVIVAVPADATPDTLKITQRHTLDGDGTSPTKVTVREEIPVGDRR